MRLDGKVCVLDIEIEGVKQVKKTDLDPILVFVKPPTMNELERRLRDRKTETEDSLQKRLDTARRELAYGIFFILVYVRSDAMRRDSTFTFVLR